MRFFLFKIQIFFPFFSEFPNLLKKHLAKAGSYFHAKTIPLLSISKTILLMIKNHNIYDSVSIISR